VRAACLLECTARKPGNVHPGAAFDDLCYADFVKSANLVAPIFHGARRAGVGETVLEAVRATQDAVGKNTNLGIVLLLTPLAAVDPAVSLRDGIGDVLRSLTVRDAELVYDAIRLSQPAGMGSVDNGDVSTGPAGTLLEMMQLAADRDAVARQYATRFDLVLNFAVPRLAAGWPAWEEAVVRLHLELMARGPDTLIARKCGEATAVESARRAEAVLQSGWPDTEAGRREVGEFDRWLRADGRRRNPGTTADLVTAALFAALREGAIVAPAIDDQPRLGVFGEDHPA
jgi:triphosphoribosyl-dephospho-CoA synthase